MTDFKRNYINIINKRQPVNLGFQPLFLKSLKWGTFKVILLRNYKRCHKNQQATSMHWPPHWHFSSYVLFKDDILHLNINFSEDILEEHQTGNFGFQGILTQFYMSGLKTSNILLRKEYFECTKILLFRE